VLDHRRPGWQDPLITAIRASGAKRLICSAPLRPGRQAEAKSPVEAEPSTGCWSFRRDPRPLWLQAQPSCRWSAIAGWNGNLDGRPLCSLLDALPTRGRPCAGVMWIAAPRWAPPCAADRNQQRRAAGARSRGVPPGGHTAHHQAAHGHHAAPSPIYGPPPGATTDFYFYLRIARQACLNPSRWGERIPARLPRSIAPGHVLSEGAPWFVASASLNELSNCSNPTHRAGGRSWLPLAAGRQGDAGQPLTRRVSPATVATVETIDCRCPAN